MRINSVLSFLLALVLLCGCEEAKCPRCGQPMSDGKCGNCVVSTDSIGVDDILDDDEKARKESERILAHSLYVQGALLVDTSDGYVIRDEAIPFLLKSARMGCDSAQCLLGVTLLHLVEEHIDIDNAVYDSVICWLKMAAEKGNVDALYYVGECYWYGLSSVDEDSEEAFKWYQKAALREDMKAQFALGRMYQSGDGVGKDEKEAVKWFRKSAEHGLNEAQCRLAMCYESGEGVEPDGTEAFKWYRKAAEQGIVSSQYKVAQCYESGLWVEKNETEAFRWYRKAAEQYDSDAQCKVASCYLAGKWGAPKDTIEALKWLYQAAESNHIDAIKQLAACCVESKSVMIDSSICSVPENRAKENADSLNQLGVKYESRGDFSEAYYYYKLAAEKGMPKAQNSLAQCYLRKQPAKAIYLQKAFIWFTSSANLGDVLGQYNLGLCYYFGTGTDINYEKAVKWFGKSAEQGYVDAQYNIGVCYSKGQGVPSSCVEAYKWYKKAADGGHADAIRIVGMMKNSSCPLYNFKW